MLTNINLISRQFRRDVRNARLLDPFQSYVLLIQAGLWSGDSRRIEISESLFNMPFIVRFQPDLGNSVDNKVI